MNKNKEEKAIFYSVDEWENYCFMVYLKEQLNSKIPQDIYDMNSFREPEENKVLRKKKMNHKI